MKVTETEYSVFRSIVKGIGVYQLVLGLTDLYAVVLDRFDYKLGGPPSHEGRLIEMAIFHSCVALILLLGTDFFCRVAFPRPPAAEKNADVA